MSGFYRAIFLDHNGRECRRDFFLPTERAVRLEIIKSGHTPLSIRRSDFSWWQREYLNTQYKAKVLRSIAFHMEVGMSPGKAFSLVIESEPNPGKRLEFEPALEVLRRGGQFSDAVEQLDMYDRSVVAMLKSGEKVGKLRNVLNTAVAHMEAKRNSWRLLAAAAGWLSFDIFTSITSVFATQFWFLPWLSTNGIETNDNAAREEFARQLELAYMLNGALLWILVIVVVLILTLALAYSTGRGGLRNKAERVIISLPFLRSFLYDGAMSDTFLLVSRMLEGHSQFAEAANTAANSTIIPGVRLFWEETVRRLFAGHGIARAMQSPILTRAEQIELEAHHNSAQLALVLKAIGEERGESAKQGTRRLIMVSTMLMVMFSVLTTAIGIWLLIVQSGGMNASLSSLGGS